MKKQSNFYMIYIAIISLALISVGGYFAVGALSANRGGEAVKVEKDNPYYSLRKNATAYQKVIYKELSDSFKEDPLDRAKISGLIVQNYIADFYTWTNKLRFNDVGGLQYLHPDVHSWVNTQALETFYNNMNHYLTNGGLQDTLEVSGVSVEVETSNIEVDEVMHDAYRVIAKWDYIASDKLDVSSYQHEAEFTLIPDSEGLFTIVEVLELEQ